MGPRVKEYNELFLKAIRDPIHWHEYDLNDRKVDKFLIGLCVKKLIELDRNVRQKIGRYRLKVSPAWRTFLDNWRVQATTLPPPQE